MKIGSFHHLPTIPKGKSLVSSILGTFYLLHIVENSRTFTAVTPHIHDLSSLWNWLAAFNWHSVLALYIIFKGWKPLLSQTHRMIEVGRDFQKSSGPTPRSDRAIYSWVPRTMSRWFFNISKDGDSIRSLANLCQCSFTLTMKKCFLMLLCFCSLTLILSENRVMEWFILEKPHKITESIY